MRGGFVQIAARVKTLDAETDARPVTASESSGNNQRTAKQIAARCAGNGAKSVCGDRKRRRIELKVVVGDERLKPVADKAETSADHTAKTIDGNKNRRFRHKRIINRARTAQVETVAQFVVRIARAVD